MSIAENPYQSPQTEAVPEKPLAVQGALTEDMLVYLKGASPWLRFVGILGFISAGMMVLWGLVSLILFPLMRDAWGDFTVALGLVMGGAMAAVFIGMGALIFFPSLFTYRFGGKIRNYLRTGAEQELEQAFKNNKSLWKFVGILCIIYLAFLPLMIVGSIIAAFASVMG
ncbi:MAG: hypothetical protein FWB99_01510 [Treponema sp.]|nr:hypothetical protein [Treponema sp.]